VKENRTGVVPTLLLLESLYCQDVKRVVCVFVFSGECVVLGFTKERRKERREGLRCTNDEAAEE